MQSHIYARRSHPDKDVNIGLYVSLFPLDQISNLYRFVNLTKTFQSSNLYAGHYVLRVFECKETLIGN